MNPMAIITSLLVILIAVILLIIFACTGWLMYTNIRARSLGIPPPALSSYNPFNRKNKFGKSNATRDGVADWVKDKINSFKNRDNDSTIRGFTEPRAFNSHSRIRSHAFSPLDPDEAWDARVGTEADGYGPIGYYEGQEHELHQTTEKFPRHEKDYEYSHNRQSDSYIGGSQAGLSKRYDEEMGSVVNPFVDTPESTIINPRETSPQGGIATQDQGHLSREMTAPDLQQIHDILVSIAYEAGNIMLSAKPSHTGSGIKKNTVDLVTETDRAVEKHVSTKLLSAFPNFKFIGEETYFPGQRLTDDPTFIVDPIDGTTNFVHNFPAFCISLGLAIEKTPVIGVIYNPLLDELYTAIKGKGAYLQKGGGDKLKQKLPLKDPEPLIDLSTCLVATEWGSDRSGANFELKCKVFTKLVASKEEGGSMVHSVRSMGSSALILAAVAAGQLDVFWEGGCWAWDVCAGWCILVESGGIIVGGNPGDWECEVEGRKYLAIKAAPSGQKKIIQEFWEVIGDGSLEYSP